VENKENIGVNGRDEERRAENFRRFGRDDKRRGEIWRKEQRSEHRRMALPQPLVVKYEDFSVILQSVCYKV